VACPLRRTLIVARDTVWNKFKGQRRELPQLWREISKAASLPPRKRGARAKKRPKPKSEVNGFNFESFEGFLSRSIEPPSWLVEGFWSDKAHGLIAGEPKSYKSLVAMDLAVSVASGKRFLGRFEVPKQGPVIYIQEENTEGMVKDRLEKISHSQGLLGSASVVGRTLEFLPPQSLPLYLLNNSGLDLTDDDHYEMLLKRIRKVGAELLVLDPLYLMIPGLNENASNDMVPVLKALMTLKNDTNCGVLLIHHYKKQDRQSPFFGGERISGTSSFHRWFESAMFTERDPSGEPHTIRLTPDHRNAPPQGAFKVTFNMGDVGDPEYDPKVDLPAKTQVSELHDQIKATVERFPGISVAELARQLDIRTERTRRLVEQGPYRLGPPAKKSSSPRVYST
jgi:hypothetical protein